MFSHSEEENYVTCIMYNDATLDSCCELQLKDKLWKQSKCVILPKTKQSSHKRSQIPSFIVSSSRVQVAQKCGILKFSEAESQYYYKHKLNNLPKSPYLLLNLRSPETTFYNNLKRTIID